MMIKRKIFRLVRTLTGYQAFRWASPDLIHGQQLPAMEDVIIQYPDHSFNYAVAVLGHRWTKAEAVIKRDAFYWQRYKDWFNVR